MYCWPWGTGSPPICPAGLTLFCALTALVISVTVTPRFASVSGFTQMRMAYGPAPKIWTCDTPWIRVNAYCRLIVA